jgi:hypothetical protein
MRRIRPPEVKPYRMLAGEDAQGLVAGLMKRNLANRHCSKKQTSNRSKFISDNGVTGECARERRNGYRTYTSSTQSDGKIDSGTSLCGNRSRKCVAKELVPLGHAKYLRHV